MGKNHSKRKRILLRKNGKKHLVNLIKPREAGIAINGFTFSWVIEGNLDHCGREKELNLGLPRFCAATKSGICQEPTLGSPRTCKGGQQRVVFSQGAKNTGSVHSAQRRVLTG